MTYSDRDNSKKRPAVESEDFARFLKLFSSDPEEAGRLYNSLQNKLVGFFRLKGVSDPGDAAADTIDRAILRVSAGAEVPDANRYCFGIARNIVKERLRFLQRENSAFHKFIENLSNSPAEQVERIHSILKPCFEQLAVEEQELLRAYCNELQGRSRTEHRRQIAETMDMTVPTLRVRVSRLRDRLTDCVQKMSNGH